MRYFVFLRILEFDIQNLLNIAIYSLNKYDKWGAHVTLAGPYGSKANLPKDRVFSRKVSIIGVSNFFLEGQNTVFLRVGAPDLKEVWDKPDYPFNPHLTIYDGPDLEIAKELYSALEMIRPFLIFHTSRLEVVTSPKGEPLLPFVPTVNIDPSYSLPIRRIEEAWEMSVKERIGLATAAIKRAKDWNLFQR